MRQLSIISHDVSNPVASKPNEKTGEFEANMSQNEYVMSAARAEQPETMSPETNDKPDSDKNNNNNTSTINIINKNSSSKSNNMIQINFVTYNNEKTNDINQMNNKE